MQTVDITSPSFTSSSATIATMKRRRQPQQGSGRSKALRFTPLGQDALTVALATTTRKENNNRIDVASQNDLLLRASLLPERSCSDESIAKLTLQGDLYSFYTTSRSRHLSEGFGSCSLDEEQQQEQRVIMTGTPSFVQLQRRAFREQRSRGIRLPTAPLSDLSFRLPSQRPRSEQGYHHDSWKYLCEVQQLLHRQQQQPHQSWGEAERGWQTVVTKVMNILASPECSHSLRMVSSTSLRSLTALIMLQALVASVEEKKQASPCCPVQRLVDTLLQSMQQHPTSLVVHVEASRSIQRIIVAQQEHQVSSSRASGAKPNPCHLLSSEPVLVILLQSLAAHYCSVALTRVLLDLLRRCQSTDMTISRWALHRAPPILLQATSHHRHDASILQAALSLLAWFCEDEACRRQIVGKNSACHLLPELMVLHPTDTLVQCNAAAALCWLVHAGPEPLPNEYVPHFVELVERHVDTASTLGNGVCLMCGVNTDEHHERIVQRIIRVGMSKHIDCAKVQEGCLRWLRFRCVPRRDIELLTPLIPLVLTAMRKHPMNPHLQAQALEVVTAWAHVPALRTALTDHAVYDLVMSVTVKHHCGSIRIQHMVVWLTTLLVQPRTAATVAFGGGVGILQELWQQNQADNSNDFANVEED